MDHPLNHDISKCDVCLNKRLEGKPKYIPQSGQDECCICMEVMAEIKLKVLIFSQLLKSMIDKHI